MKSLWIGTVSSCKEHSWVVPCHYTSRCRPFPGPVVYVSTLRGETVQVLISLFGSNIFITHAIIILELPSTTYLFLRISTLNCELLILMLPPHYCHASPRVLWLAPKRPTENGVLARLCETTSHSRAIVASARV